jgi:CMP-N-acetylneuraminic acid synthetase
MSLKKIIAIVPARGGSKRIPRKNIIDFHGKPMILHTLQAAKDSKLFDKIVVSTDCPLIKDICDDAGFIVPFFRTEYYDNYSTVSQATITTLNQAESFFNEKYDVVIQLMPNSPLRTSIDIIHQYESFCEQSPLFSISCTKFGWQNPWWSFEKNSINLAEWKFGQALLKRSQDLPELFAPNGAVWIADVNELKKTKTFYTSSTKFFEMDFINSVDIDTPDDLIFAKKLFLLQRI